MKTSRTSQVFWGCLTMAYMAVLLLASLPAKIIPGEPSPFKQMLHNSLHIPAYAVLTFLIWKSLGDRHLWGAAIAAFAYGLFNECVQMFVPGRTASWGDVARNALGCLIALWVLRKCFSPADKGSNA